MEEYNHKSLHKLLLGQKEGQYFTYIHKTNHKKHHHFGNRTENGNAHWPMWAKVDSSQLLSMSKHQLKIQHLKICVGIHTFCALVY